MDKYLLFIDKLKLIHEKYFNFQEQDNFNIFKVMFNESDEVNLHSKFLYELLVGTKLSQEFFRLFLETLDLGFLEKEFIVMREYKNIDLLIKNEEVAIIIENKIYAEDQDKQLFRYYETMRKENYAKDNIYIFYLTLDGHYPSENSIYKLEGEKEINCISYGEDIAEWLKLCMKESIFDNSLREVLHQYRKIILELSGKGNGGNSIMEIRNHIMASPENLGMAINLVDGLTEAKIEIQYLFWRDLERALKEKNYIIENLFNMKYNKNWISDFYKKAKNNKWYGMSFKILNIDSKKELYLTIEIYGSVYWGFRVVENEDVTRDFKGFDLLRKNFKEMLSVTGFKDYDDEKTNWIGYIKFNNDLDFRGFNSQDIFNLVNDELRQEIIQNCANDIDKGTKVFLEKIKNLGDE